MTPKNLPTEEDNKGQNPIFDDWNPSGNNNSESRFEGQDPIGVRHVSDFTIPDVPSHPPMEENLDGNSQEPSGDRAKDTAFKVLAVIGLIVVLGAVAWAGVNAAQFAPAAFRAVANTFVGVTQVFIPQERIIVSVDDELVTTGERFEVSWEHRGKQNDGSYTLSYECKAGLHLEITNDAGQESIVFCNTPINILDTQTNITLIPISTSERLVEVPISVQFTENGSSRVRRTGETSIRIANPNIEEQGITLNSDDGSDDNTPTTNNDNTENLTTNTTPTPGNIPGTPEESTELFDEQSGTVTGTSNPNGKPDLKVTIIEVGRVSRIDNSFVATSTISGSDRAAVRFEVINLGTKESGQWHFSAVLPTSPSHIFSSKTQQNLLPGDRIEFTLGFDSIRDPGDNEVIINIDPTNSVRNEVTRDNNIVKAIITVNS